MESEILQMWILLFILVTPVTVTVLPKNSKTVKRFDDTLAISEHRNIRNNVPDIWKKLQDDKTLLGSSRNPENQVTKLSQASTADLSGTRMTPGKYQNPFSRTFRWNGAARPASGHIRTPRMNSIQRALVEQRELKEILDIMLHSIFNDLRRVGSSAAGYRLVANHIGGGKHRSNSYSRSGTSFHGSRSQQLYKHVFRRAADSQRSVVEYIDKLVEKSHKSSTSPPSTSSWDDYVQQTTDPGHVMTIREKLLKILAFIINPFGIGGAINHARTTMHWQTPANMLTWHRIINTHMRKNKKQEAMPTT